MTYTREQVREKIVEGILRNRASMKPHAFTSDAYEYPAETARTLVPDPVPSVEVPSRIGGSEFVTYQDGQWRVADVAYLSIARMVSDCDVLNWSGITDDMLLALRDGPRGELVLTDAQCDEICRVALARPFFDQKTRRNAIRAAINAAAPAPREIVGYGVLDKRGYWSIWVATPYTTLEECKHFAQAGAKNEGGRVVPLCVGE